MIDRAGVLECLKELGAAGGEPERYAALVDFACSSVYARLKCSCTVKKQATENNR